MSRQAQAERERQARVILGESEKQIAASFAEASQAYVNNPTALALACHEHALRRSEGKRCAGDRPEFGSGHHEPRRHERNCFDRAKQCT